MITDRYGKPVEKENKYLTCPYCYKGQVRVPGIKNGKPVTVLRDCRKCRGTGKLVVINDNEKLKGIIKQ